MHYIIIGNSSLEGLASQVNLMAAQKHTPIGGVTVDPTAPLEARYIQAMILAPSDFTPQIREAMGRFVSVLEAAGPEAASQALEQFKNKSRGVVDWPRL